MTVARSRGALGGVAIVVATVAATLSWSTSASASGFAAAHFGGEHGSVVETNPLALYYNPGGIGFSEGAHFYIDGTIALRGGSWDHPLAPTDPTPDPPGGEGANNGKATFFNVFGGPALGATMRLGNFALGAGLFVPFGGRESWDTNDRFTNSQFPLAAAGVQRWHIIDGAITFIYGTVGAAYRLGPVSLGVSGNLVLGSVQQNQAKNPNASGLPDTLREGRANLDVSGVTGSFGIGAMVEAVPKRLWLGASYQSQPNMGAQTMNGKLTITSQTGSLASDVTFTNALPDVLRAGARWRVHDALELRLYGDYTRWSVVKSQCVALKGYPCAVYADGSDASGGGVLSNFKRDWKDTFGVHGGGSVWVKPTLELFAGAGYETAATTDANLDPSIADADNISLAGGVRVFAFDWIYVGASYTHLYFFDRDNTGKSALASYAYPTQQQDGGGKYTQWVGFFNINLEKTF